MLQRLLWLTPVPLLFLKRLKLSSFAPGLDAIAADGLFGSTTSAGSGLFSAMHEIISMVEKSIFLIYMSPPPKM